MLLRTLTVGALLFLSASQAFAQLVVVHDHFTIVEVRPRQHELVVSRDDANADDDLKGRLDVFITDKTQIVDPDGRPLTWRSLNPGGSIHVDGGLRLNVKIDATRIVVDRV